MSPNFLPCERDQQLLMPTDLREWLPADHLAWFVLDTVAELDLGPFYRAYRDDGWGRAAHDPEMMVALALYAYATGERSSRRIERRCTEDIGYRVIPTNEPMAPIMQRIAGMDEPPEPQPDEALAEIDRVILAITVDRVAAVTHMGDPTS